MLTEKEIEQHKYREKYVNKYMKEVVAPLLPNTRPSSVSSFGNPDNLHYSATIGSQETNDRLFDSKYYFPGKTEFIHYTTVRNLENILNEKGIRMYDFNYLNDPQEFVYSAKQLNIPTQYARIDDLKENLFSLSMCLYDDETNKDEFDMWRFYGDAGKGVGIVLEFDDANRKNWLQYNLSKVYYAEDDLNDLFEFQKRHDKFHIENKFFVKDHYDLIYHLLGFHKIGIYKTENEVRLLRHFEKNSEWTDHETGYVRYAMNSRYQKSAYTLLELDCPERLERFETFKGTPNYEKAIKLFPVVKIKKVILGYEIDKNTGWDIYDNVSRIAKRNLGYVFPFEESYLRQHFSRDKKK
jgi:hypothetical protein